jgi:formiminotetrahydrofolate cyclodeaminase
MPRNSQLFPKSAEVQGSAEVDTRGAIEANGSQLTLLELPAGTLLEKFGSGTHSPGSGSAAALMGLLSCRLIQTVAALSLAKPAYRRDHAKIGLVANAIADRKEPALRSLFQRDAEAFDRVIKARLARDGSPKDSSERRRHSESALEYLREATAIPFEIADVCVGLIDDGVAIFDMGFKAARGDTGAAISAAVAAAMASVFVINLNLKSFRGSDWSIEQRARCDALHDLLTRKQLEAFERVMTLRAEDVSSVGLNLGGLESD